MILLTVMKEKNKIIVLFSDSNQIIADQFNFVPQSPLSKCIYTISPTSR